MALVAIPGTQATRVPAPCPLDSLGATTVFGGFGAFAAPRGGPFRAADGVPGRPKTDYPVELPSPAAKRPRLVGAVH